MARHELMDFAKQRAIAAGIAECQHLWQQILGERGRSRRMLKQRFDLGGEGE
jgi:hypothetical protein